MFTPLQFSQLAAAAWSGPAASITTSASVTVLASGHSATYYCATYSVGGVLFQSPASSSACPFAATWSALWAALSAGVLTGPQFTAGEQAVEQACSGSVVHA